MDKIKFKNS